MVWQRAMRVRCRRGSRGTAGGRGGEGSQGMGGWEALSSYEVLTWTVGGILWFIQQELLHLYKLEPAKV